MHFVCVPMARMPVELRSRRFVTHQVQRKNVINRVRLTRLASVVATTTRLTRAGHASNSSAKMVMLTAVGIAA